MILTPIALSPLIPFRQKCLGLLHWNPSDESPLQFPSCTERERERSTGGVLHRRYQYVGYFDNAPIAKYGRYPTTTNAHTSVHNGQTLPSPLLIMTRINSQQQKKTLRKQACETCHGFKRRCERDHDDAPCLKCQDLGVACVPHIPAVRRRRRAQKNKDAKVRISKGQFPIIDITSFVGLEKTTATRLIRKARTTVLKGLERSAQEQQFRVPSHSPSQEPGSSASSATMVDSLLPYSTLIEPLPLFSSPGFKAGYLTGDCDKEMEQFHTAIISGELDHYISPDLPHLLPCSTPLIGPSFWPTIQSPTPIRHDTLGWLNTNITLS